MDRLPTLETWDVWCGICLYNVWWHISKQGKDYILLLCALVAMILIGTTDSVLYVRLSRKMDGYEWFLSQVAITLAFCLISWPVTWYQMYISKTITPEIREGTSLRVYAMIAMLDAMANMMGTLPLPYIPGPVVSVLGKISIPMLMGGSMFYLNTRYRLTHFMGAIIILTGVLVNLIPFMMYDDDTSSVPSNHWFWAILVIASIIPSIMSSLYKERALKGAPTNVWYFNAWVALIQLVWGMTMVWVIFIPMPPPATHIRLIDFPQYLIDSIVCFTGFSSQPLCQDTWAVFAVFIVFNVVLNVLVLYVFKHGSAVLATMVGTSTMILTNMTYHVPWIAGEAETHGFSMYNLLALAIIVGGIILYNLKSEEKRNHGSNSTTLSDKHDDDDDDDDDEEMSKYTLVSSSSENEDMNFVSPLTEKYVSDGEITEMKTFKKKEEKV